MTSDSSTQMLEGEHFIIAKVIGATPAPADLLEVGQVMDVKTLHGVIKFMRISKRIQTDTK